MSKVITIKDRGIGLEYDVGIPDSMIKEIHDGNIDVAVNFAKMVLSNIERTNDGSHTFNKILNGHKFYFDLDEENQAMKEIENDFILHGNYEPFTTKLVEEHVKAGDVCVDVGASHGYFTLLFAKLVGDQGKVYAFEPTDNQFKYLTKNIVSNGYNMRVIAENVAAWSSEAVNPELKINMGSTRDIRGVRLDDILPTKVDFIKIDVDGTELEVLRGLRQTIENNPQLKMVIEIYPTYVRNMGLDPQEMMNFLDKYFTCSRIGGDFAGEDYYNLFCIRK